MNLEQLGLVGVFIAGAIPWFEAVAVVPAGILFGLNPYLVILAAVLGNSLTIFLFAFAGARIRNWVQERRRAKGQSGEPGRFARAQRAFQKYGFYGMAAVSPLLIGTQFAAAVAVAAGVRPLKTSIVITASMIFWAVLVSLPFFALGFFDSQR